MAGNGEFAVKPWAYAGTDDTAGAGNTYPFNSKNSLPAMIVWLFLTTNSTYANEAVGNDAAVTQIAGAVNLTNNCVKSLLRQYTRATRWSPPDQAVSAAFDTVIDSFHSIGPWPDTGNPGNYPPNRCPGIDDILLLAAPIKTMIPTNGNPAAVPLSEIGRPS